jgi:multicomponent Na+:H+ antiporter subunit D
MTLVLAIMLPLLSAFLIPFFHLARKTLSVGLIGIMGLASISAALAAAYTGWYSPAVSLLGGWAPDIGIALVGDRLSSAFLLMTAIGSGAALACAWRSSEEALEVLCPLLPAARVHERDTPYGGPFQPFVFYEIFSVAAYLLVAFPCPGRLLRRDSSTLYWVP